jgi:hypothetical protein
MRELGTSKLLEAVVFHGAPVAMISIASSLPENLIRDGCRIEIWERYAFSCSDDEWT